MIDPFSAVKRARLQHFYHHRGRERPVLHTNVVLFAAFKAASYIIARIAEDDDRIIAKRGRPLKGIFHHSLAVSFALVLR